MMNGKTNSTDELGRMIKRDYRRLRKTVREYPVTSILTAFSGGLLIGICVALGGKSKK